MPLPLHNIGHAVAETHCFSNSCLITYTSFAFCTSSISGYLFFDSGREKQVDLFRSCRAVGDFSDDVAGLCQTFFHSTGQHAGVAEDEFDKEIFTDIKRFLEMFS